MINLKTIKIRFLVCFRFSISFFFLNLKSLLAYLKDFDIFSDEAQFLTSRKGCPILVDTAGYFYNKAKNSKTDASKIFWQCQKIRTCKCPARATTDGFQIVRYLHEHSHPPQNHETVLE